MEPAHPPDPRDALTLQVYELFRVKGYEGVSIGDISAATGLGRSSLYHHFPGGKAQMAEAVVAFAHAAIAREVLSALQGPGRGAPRLEAMLEGARHLYRGGPCVLANLLPGVEGEAFGQKLKAVFAEWIGAAAEAFEDCGRTPAEARADATAMIALVQGGLVLARAMGDLAAFDDALDAARRLIPAAP